MLEEISNIYLGYFDLSRITREQVLRVVWVIEAKDKSYIFNAISGALIEEW
jgi:regulatory protein YycI of two-component signal transduction system YycFG